MDEAADAEAISGVLPLLARRLQADQSGRAILQRITESAEPSTAELTEWLQRGGTPTVATVVTGGYIDNLVNIAHADVVNISLPNKNPAPAQLPNATRDFTDRQQEVETARRFLRPEAPGAGAPVLAVSGLSGVGKSALAIQVSTLLAAAFPDAQLYVDLRGQDGRGLDPSDVLDAFLRAKGISGTRIPADLADRALMYRAIMSQGRNLVLLDNASNEGQVRPLIPSGSGCAAIVTSRRRLAVLEGALPIALETLSLDYGLELLSKIAGEERVAAEPEAASQIVRLCGLLPLAIRIVGAKLAAKPHWRIRRMADRLRSERTRLVELSFGDLDVRGGFMLSYQELDPELQRAFRMPSVLASPHFTSWILAALLEIAPEDADQMAERLVDLQLLEVVEEDETGEVRYRYHDLLRVFAGEQVAQAESNQERSAALERALGALLGVAKQGLYQMSKHSKRDPDPTLALIWPLPADLIERLTSRPYAWFSAEYPNLIAAIHQAYEEGLWECTWELADSMHYFFRVRARWKDWRETHELALDAARRAGNRRGEGWTLRNLGNAYRDLGELDKAAGCFTQCLETFQALDNSLGQAAALNNLGELAMDRGQLADATAYFERCLPAWAQVGDTVGVAYVTNHLGWVNLQQGRWESATSYFDESLPMFRELNDHWGEAHALRSIGNLLRECGLLAQAQERLSQSELIFAEFEDRAGQAWVRMDLAWTRLAQGYPDEARDLLDSAIATFRELSERRGEAWCLMVMADVHRAQGRTEAAAVILEEVALAFRSRGETFAAGVSQCLLGETYLQAGLIDRAEITLRGALEVLRRVGAGYWVSRAEHASRRAAEGHP
jgi:tetratricopeptide (TPR) repeat protein